MAERVCDRVTRAIWECSVDDGGTAVPLMHEEASNLASAAIEAIRAQPENWRSVSTWARFLRDVMAVVGTVTIIVSLGKWGIIPAGLLFLLMIALDREKRHGVPHDR